MELKSSAFKAYDIQDTYSFKALMRKIDKL